MKNFYMIAAFRCALRTIKVSLILLSLIVSEGQASSDKSVFNSRDGILANIFQDNKRFVEAHDKSHFERFFNEQHPRATILGCCDSRFHMNAIDSRPENDLFVVRNIGNQINTAQGSIEYGVYHLKTSVLMIIGHSNCGAVKAVMDKKLQDKISGGKFFIEYDILRELQTVVNYKTKGGYQKIDPALDLNENVRRNIINQARDASKIFDELIKKDQLVIVGSFYDFTNSMGKGYGKLVEVVRYELDKSTNKVRVEVF